MVRGLLVDYGITTIPILPFIALMIVFAAISVCLLAIFALLRHSVPNLASMPNLGLFTVLAFAAMVVYGNRMKARIAVDRESITIRRPLFPPLVVPRDAIVKAEVRENRRPVPLWLLGTVLVMGLASYFAITRGGLLQSGMNNLVLWFNVVLFSLAAFYHGHIRARYTRILALTTANNRMAVIYADNPESIAGMLGVS
ncbi:hypothetical protein ASZ90_009419 [hydrocarbon metagenome]|uniref:Uncharacterized protein n=1 Tax=hydrocarbon metagenome TaxID=938273 RepID=A0A0W8FIU5_9ZZZZ